jgi:hypothetical protein
MTNPPKETTLTDFIEKARRSDKNSDPSDQQNHRIESQPQNSGSFRRRGMSSTPPEKKHIHHISSRMRTDIKAEQHTNDPIRFIRTGECALVMEQTAISDPKQDERPQCLDIASTPMLFHLDE